MKDNTKGKLLVVILVSLLALGCGTACGLHEKTTQETTTGTSLNESDNNCQEVNNTSETLKTYKKTTDSNEHVVRKSENKKSTNRTVINNTTKPKNTTKINTTLQNNTTKNNQTNLNSNQKVSNNSSKNVEHIQENDTEEKYFTNDSNLVTKIEEFATN